MSSVNICPSCQKPLGPVTSKCIECGWAQKSKRIKIDPSDSESIEDQVVETDLHIENALNAVDEDDFSSALRSMNRAILDAEDDRLGECYSLRGYIYLKGEDFERAEGDCTEAISRHWAEAQTYAWRAAARGEQNNWPKAFDDLAVAYEISGSDKDQYLALIDSYIETASEYFRAQIVAEKQSADLFFARGWIYFRAGRTKKAERDFKHAMDLQADHWKAALGLAGLNLESKQPEESLRLAEIALQGADSEGKREALFIRAKANQQLGDGRQVSKDLNRLKKLASGNTKDLLELGRLRFELGEYVRAISDLTSVLKKKGDMHQAFLIRADAYREIQNYGLAISDYSKFIRLFPESLPARLNRGDAYLKTNQLERALADFDRVLEIDGVSVEGFLGRSKVFLQQKQLDVALTECQKASRLDNQRADVFSTSAEIYYQLCDYSRAIEEFVRAERNSRSAVDKAQCAYRRGNAYYELNQLENAHKYFHKATRLNPNHAGAWIWKAAVCAKLEKWPQAIVGLEHAIRARPAAAEQYGDLGRPVAEKAVAHFSRMLQRQGEQPDLFRNRGLAHQFLGDVGEATKDYSRVLEMVGDDSETMLRRGQCLTLAREHASAIEDFSAVLGHDRRNPAARYWRAVALNALGETESALSDVIKAIKLNRKDARYHLLHGDIMRQQKEWRQVIRSLERAICLDAGDSVPYRQRGKAYSAIGQNLRAISDYARAIEISPRQPDLYVLRGKSFVKQDELDLALDDFEAAIALDDQCVNAYIGRAIALTAQGEYEPALIWLTKSLHRFEAPQDLCKILYQRGKTFFKMGRFDPSINDFVCVVNLVREDRDMVANARVARAAAYAQKQEWESAAKDLLRVLKHRPKSDSLRAAVQWLVNDERNGDCPNVLQGPEKAKRPMKPDISRADVEIAEKTDFEREAPFDSWIVRTPDKREFGPVSIFTMRIWASEGRLGPGTQLLRADWPQWKRAEKIFPELIGPSIKSFPEISLTRPKKQTPGDKPLI